MVVAAKVAATDAAPLPRIEIVEERRRSHDAGFRARVLAAASAPGARVEEVAQRYRICTSLIYRWRRVALGPPLSVSIPVESWFSRTLRAVVTLCGVEDAGTEKLESSTAVHGPLQHFQPIDLALYRARRPRQIQRGLDGGDVAPQAPGKILQRRGDRCVEDLAQTC